MAQNDLETAADHIEEEAHNLLVLFEGDCPEPEDAQAALSDLTHAVAAYVAEYRAGNER